MSEWKEKYLHKVVDIRVSNVDKKIYPSKSLVRLCNYMDAYSNDYISSKISFSIGSADINEIQKFGLKIDDVVITKDSETPEDIAVSSVVIEDLNNVVCGYHLAILRPDKDELDGKYLMFKLKSDELKRYFLSVAKGSTRFGLTIGDIENAKIKFPSLPAQQHIARILSTADAVIENTQAAIAKYQAIKQGMLQDVFTRGIDLRTGALRPRYEDAPHLYKESALGWIPREWEVKPSNQFVHFINGRAYALEEWETSGTPVIRLQNLTGSGDTYYYSNLQLPEEQYCHDGDLLYMWSATFGPYIWNGSKAIYHYHIWKVECSNKMLQQYYYYDLLRFTQTVLSEASGSTMAHITKEGMEKRLTLMPPLNEQKMIAEHLTAIDTKLRTEQTYLQKMQALKKGLMEDLLTGKVRVAEEVIRE